MLTKCSSITWKFSGLISLGFVGVALELTSGTLCSRPGGQAPAGAVQARRREPATIDDEQLMSPWVAYPKGKGQDSLGLVWQQGIPPGSRSVPRGENPRGKLSWGFTPANLEAHNSDPFASDVERNGDTITNARLKYLCMCWKNFRMP